MLKYVDFIYPNIKPLPTKDNIQEWVNQCNTNLNGIITWNKTILPYLSEGAPLFEYKYNIKAAHINPKDWQLFADSLHPDDLARYAPTSDETVAVGKCRVDTDAYYVKSPLCDTERAEDIEYALMIGEENEFFSTGE